MKYIAGIILLLIVCSALMQRNTKLPFEVKDDGRIPLVEEWMSRQVAYPYTNIANWGPVRQDTALGDYTTQATIRQHEHSQYWRLTPYQFRISADGKVVKGRENTGAIPYEEELRARIGELQTEIAGYKTRLKDEAALLDSQAKYFLNHNVTTAESSLNDVTAELRRLIDGNYR
ncbi:hypothetical protein DES53_106130 [Roseimicrobium gellanilyticum]|uniref:Uncharacterized protein n=1 Tax=Roseimicrobium gellanilyticum TaxID=748857 RepID=A0A366HJK1_9BACT|nr:hypothetical protein [Roseimicrobium gellanilyticum]RBP42424.1 hypothetical protein DES53_106130 [Roseimicrobium gellanilyticum]